MFDPDRFVDIKQSTVDYYVEARAKKAGRQIAGTSPVGHGPSDCPDGNRRLVVHYRTFEMVQLMAAEGTSDVRYSDISPY